MTEEKIPRAVPRAAVEQALSESPVVALLGARQVGKTTLAREIAAASEGPTTYFDLERLADREALSATPDRLLREPEGLVILDEIQRSPALLEALRPIGDDPDRKAVFLVVGSASPSLVKGVSEGLAERVPVVHLGGFSVGEVGAESQTRLWRRGGFPRAFLADSDDAWSKWMENSTATLLERDLPLLTGAPPAAEFSGMRELACWHGQIWNATEIARMLDARPAAVNRYRGLVAGSFLIRELPPWFEDLGKRLVKSPKIYLRDSGMQHHLLGFKDLADVAHDSYRGASWEGFGLEQTLLAHGEREAFFYRTQRGAELDLLLFRNRGRWGFDFKCSDAPRTTKSMHIVLADLGLDHLFVVYPGDDEYPLADRITALPLARVPGLPLRPSG